jgi:hypothetical protein
MRLRPVPFGEALCVSARNFGRFSQSWRRRRKLTKRGLPSRGCSPSFLPSKGRCQSGRMSTLGKRVWQKCHRGFESLPVRHPLIHNSLCVFVRIHGVLWDSGLSRCRMVDHPARSKSWKCVGNRTAFCRGFKDCTPASPTRQDGCPVPWNSLTFSGIRSESDRSLPGFKIGS